MGWWDLQRSHSEQISWHRRRREQHGIVSCIQLLKHKAKIWSQSKWLKFRSWLKVKWFDSLVPTYECYLCIWWYQRALNSVWRPAGMQLRIGMLILGILAREHYRFSSWLPGTAVISGFEHDHLSLTRCFLLLCFLCFHRLLMLGLPEVLMPAGWACLGCARPEARDGWLCIKI